MSQNTQQNSLALLKSAYATENTYMPTTNAIEWLEEQNRQVHIKLEKIGFSQLQQWEIDENEGRLRHTSGKFFSIDGIEVKTNWGPVAQWQQPIINQPEIGFLGFIVKEINGVLHFLMQAKIEPGNVNYVQLSPTLQATRSNYTQVHKGKRPLYLEFFQNAKDSQIFLDQLQSEQGGRFLKKRNRNIIIHVQDDIPLYENFTWLSLAQIKQLIKADNLINMDTRTVISGISYGRYSSEAISFFNFLGNTHSLDPIKKTMLKSALTSEGALNTVETIIAFLTKLKSNFDLEVTKCNLRKLNNWTFDDYAIYHNEHKYFKVIAVSVEIGNREVVNWTQPMVEPAQEGLCAFVCKEINGLLHFAVQAKLECGNFDIIEFAPTVQCLTGNYRHTKEGTLPFLEYVLQAKEQQIIYDTLQSEEGGRFYREQNRNMIVLAENELPVDLPPNYIWMTLYQLYTFIKYNNYLNIQARSLIAAISFV